MIDPKELQGHLNRYYEVIFESVREHDGLISDITGDSMLAVWGSAQPEVTIRRKACLAVLDILRTVDLFNKSSALRFDTRYALHYGRVLLGHVGSRDYYVYRPVGDVVNTAVKIEDLNKLFGTSILASEEVMEGIDELLTREVGQFLLAGKLSPVRVFELICLRKESTQQQTEHCAIFSEGLSFFRNRSWKKASRVFNQCLKIDQNDGAASFYLDLCQLYQITPPDEDWTGVVFRG